MIAYSVSQRTREIGIRMALGAQQPMLISMFVRHGLWLTGIGVACGLAGAFAVMRLMSALLFNVSPVDPITYAAVTAGVVVTAYLACCLLYTSPRPYQVASIATIPAENNYAANFFVSKGPTYHRVKKTHIDVSPWLDSFGPS